MMLLIYLLDEESPDWRDGVGRAPGTYALMSALERHG